MAFQREKLEDSDQRRAEWQSKYFRNLEELFVESLAAYSTIDFLLILKQVRHISTGSEGWMGSVVKKEGSKTRDRTELYEKREDALEEGTLRTNQWQALMD